MFEMVSYPRTVERMALPEMLSKEQIQIDFARELHSTNH